MSCSCDHCQPRSSSDKSLDTALEAVDERIDTLKTTLVLLTKLPVSEMSVGLSLRLISELQELEELKNQGLLAKELTTPLTPAKPGDIQGMDERIAKCERMLVLFKASGGDSENVKQLEQMIAELKFLRNGAAAEVRKTTRSGSAGNPTSALMALLQALSQTSADSGSDSDSD